MSKYQGLSDQLAGQSGKEWRTSFDEVAGLLGGDLPKTARSGVAWWANDPAKPQAKAWLDKGWQVRDVDPGAGTVIFMKAEAAKPKAKGGATASGGKKAAGSPKASASKAAAKPASKPQPASKNQAAPKAKTARLAPVEPAAAPAAEPSAAAPEPAKRSGAEGEPAFLDRLPGGNKTAVVGGIAAAVLGVGALIARAFLRKR